MTKALHTPFAAGDAQKVGAKLFRKQVLPLGKVTHEGQTIEFTGDYLDELVRNFTAEGADQTPFVLVDRDNRHTDDPEKFRGDVKGLERGPDGLYALLELSDDGAELVSKNPKLGASVRIIENGNGRSIQHVAGTLDPVVKGMKPWEAVEFSADKDATVTDLTSASFEASDAPLSPSERTVLRDLASRATSDTDSDEDAERALAKLLAETEGPELSDAQREAIELANRKAADADRRVSEIEQTLAQERFERKRDELVDAGVPPAAINLAEPILRGGSGVIELSNGTKANAHDVVEKLLDEFKGMIDLSELGRGADSGDSEREEASRKAREWAEASA